MATWEPLYSKSNETNSSESINEDTYRVNGILPGLEIGAVSVVETKPSPPWKTVMGLGMPTWRRMGLSGAESKPIR